MLVQATKRQRGADIRQPGRRTAGLPDGFPRGRRSPKGILRWYLVPTPEGMEYPMAEKVKQLVPRDLLGDAFVVSKERWSKRAGAWSKSVVPMWPGCFLAATRDAAALDKVLAGLSFRVRVAGSGERAYQPMAAGAQEFLERAMDAGRVVRGSVGEVSGGELRVTSGPLAGQEGRILRWDRRKRWALVDVGSAEGGSVEALALDVPVKR